VNRIIFLNGPPRAGKDTAANAICAAFPNALKLGFAVHLKRATHAAYGLPHDLPFDAFEAVKDQALPEFFGLTPRAAYIAHSETYMKPLHGKEVFGQLWLRAVKASNAPLIVVPDSGFVDEALVGIREVGAENALLIRIHAEGRGKTFAGDSRSHISLPGVVAVDIQNDGEELEFRAQILATVRGWLRGCL
jgi:hypothetical protein